MEEKKDVLILAIESSCDETAAAVVKNGREVLSNVISSQIALHTLYGGVVPEIASRKHIEKINIVELLNQAIGEFEDKFEAKKLEILLEAKESEIYILADSRYMYRIVENLFSNISKYALENSRVYIDIIKKSNEVYIEMKNISKEKLNISAEELMQRFVRGDKSRTTEGSGLGISIAQNLTEIQKGVFNLKLDGDLFRVELIFNIL